MDTFPECPLENLSYEASIYAFEHIFQDISN